MYTKSDFNKDLENQLAHYTGIFDLSNWAHEIYLYRCEDFEEGLIDVIMELIMMQEGEEFELSFEEIKNLAFQLQKKK